LSSQTEKKGSTVYAYPGQSQCCTECFDPDIKIEVQLHVDFSFVGPMIVLMLK